MTPAPTHDRKWTFEDLWSLYTDSGFVYPKKMELLQPHLEAISHTWKNILYNPGGVAKMHMVEREGKLLSTLALTRTYPRTWLVHHMASRGNPMGMMRTVGEAVEWMAENPELSYGRFYWTPGNHMVAALFQGLGKAMASGGAKLYNTALHNYYLIDLNQVWPMAEQAAPGVEVWQAGYPLPAEITARLFQWSGPLAWEVEGLQGEGLGLESLGRLYSEMNLVRDRVLLVGMVKGRVAAMALAEFSSLGTNFSFYLNRFKLLYDREPGKRGQVLSACRALLGELCRYYESKGQPFLVCLAKPEEDTVLPSLGFRPRKTYASLTLSKPESLEQALKYIDRYYRLKSRMKNRSASGEGPAEEEMISWGD